MAKPLVDHDLGARTEGARDRPHLQCGAVGGESQKLRIWLWSIRRSAAETLGHEQKKAVRKTGRPFAFCLVTGLKHNTRSKAEVVICCTTNTHRVVINLDRADLDAFTHLDIESTADDTGQSIIAK